MPRSVSLDVEEAIRNGDRHLVPHLGRANGVGVDQEVGHARNLPASARSPTASRWVDSEAWTKRCAEHRSSSRSGTRSCGASSPTTTASSTPTSISATDIDGMVGEYDELERIHEGLRDRARLHVLHGRARPAPGVPNAERPHARVRRTLRGTTDPVRPPRPRRRADRRGRPLPRPGRPRDQAPPARPALPAERRTAGARLRPRRRASRPDPDPRRPRPAADRGRPRRPRRRRTPTRS